MPLPNPFHREPQRLSSAPAQVQDHENVPDIWVRCDNERCRAQLYVKEFERNLKVCQKCDYHFRMSARERVEQLVDPDSFWEHDAGLTPADPLQFVSLGQPYQDRVREAQQKTELPEAIVCGSARISGLAVELAVLDFGFLAASMGSVVGEKIARAAERAIEQKTPLVTVSCSGGARMHEGIFSLMQMAKAASAVARLNEARVPLISVLADPTTGGVTASFAGLGDVLVAEPGALVGFAGPRVIEQITKQKLPPGAQRAEFLLEHGMLDMVVHRRDLRPTLGKLLRLYGAPAASTNGRN